MCDNQNGNGEVIIRLLIKEKNKEEYVVEYIQPFCNKYVGKKIEYIKELYYRDVFMSFVAYNGILVNNQYLIPKEQIERIECSGISFVGVNSQNGIII